MKSILTVGSLFSGIGGLDRGFERAGFELRWQVEIDGFCRRVLAKHWPQVPKYEDVRDVGAHNLEWVDVIVGGFPCQPVSVAGKRRGQDDERWLWPEFARIIGELRPQYVVAENVPGLIRRGLGDVLSDLAAHGYDAEWQVIPAATVGAPHLRERVFILAYPDGDNGDGRGGTVQVGRLWSAETLTRFGDAARAQWATEPGVGMLAHGVRSRVDQLTGLGNAVVPQVAQYVAECVMAHATQR